MKNLLLRADWLAEWINGFVGTNWTYDILLRMAGVWMCSICGNGRQLRARMLVFVEQQKDLRAAGVVEIIVSLNYWRRFPFFFG
jgi:hypothetical protein